MTAPFHRTYIQFKRLGFKKPIGRTNHLVLYALEAKVKIEPRFAEKGGLEVQRGLNLSEM